MQLAILLLLVAALALLVLALVSGNTTLAIFSIVVSVIAVAVIVRGRRQRQELAAQRVAEAERQAQIEADKDETTRVLAAATAEASRRAAAQDAGTGGSPSVPLEQPSVPLEQSPAPNAANAATGTTEGRPAEDGPVDGEPAAADTIAPVGRYGQSRVWVIDGRPRYHMAECRVLDGTVPEAVPLAQAVEDGFTPCAVCDPDNKLVG